MPEELKPEVNYIPVPPQETNLLPAPNGTVMRGGSMQSVNFSKGNSGWQLNANGDIEAQNGIFRGTITVDNLYFTRQTIYSAFESGDAWAKNGVGLSLGLGGSALSTSTVLNNENGISAEIFGGRGLYLGTKNPIFLCGLECNNTTAQVIYFGLSNLAIGDGTEDGAGFKILNNTLYAIHTLNDGATATEYTTEITGITLTNPNEYKVIYKSGSKIEFYVNNVLKVTHTSNLHDATYDDLPALMGFNIKTTETVGKTIYLSYVMFAQDY